MLRRATGAATGTLPHLLFFGPATGRAQPTPSYYFLTRPRAADQRKFSERGRFARAIASLLASLPVSSTGNESIAYAVAEPTTPSKVGQLVRLDLWPI
jgi:hypothetical protein